VENLKKMDLSEQEIKDDLKKCYLLKLEKQKLEHTSLSKLSSLYAISQTYYDLSYSYYLKNQIDEALLSYEIAQIYFSRYLKQRSGFGKRTAAKQ
jgi:hypothetical protein